MIIVMEGTNSSGKTSFAEYLKKTMNLPVIHLNDRTLLNNSLDKETLAYGFNHAAIEMAKAIEANNPDAIILFDRFHLSEDIYGRYVRGYASRHTRMIDLELREARAVGLFFDSEGAEKRSGKKQYRDEYMKLIMESKISWVGLTLDGTNGKLCFNIVKGILEVLEYARQ